jgi:hypothetical protein
VSKPKSERPRRDIVTLSDLAPRQDVKGGARQRVFGAVHGSLEKPAGPSQPGQKPSKKRKGEG